MGIRDYLMEICGKQSGAHPPYRSSYIFLTPTFLHATFESFFEMSLFVRKTRHPDQVKQLLGDMYRDEPRHYPDIPRSLSKPEEYDTSHIKQILAYTDERLRSKRNITPPNEGFIQLCRKHAILYLTTDKAEEKEDAAKIIQLFEEHLQSQNFLQGVRNSDEGSWQETILGIRRLRYYTVYGDYMNFFLKLFREDIRAMKYEGWEAFNVQPFPWTHMAEELFIEQEDWKQYCSAPASHNTVPASKVKNHLAVSHACKATLHDFHNVLALIYAYAERNKLVHSTLETLIQSRRWTDLAATLKRDLDDVQRTIPNDQKWLQIALTWLLKGIIQDFFKHDDPNMFFPDDPTTWVPSDLLVELTSRKGSAADEDERARKFKELLRKEAKKTIKKYRKDAVRVESFRRIRKVILRKTGEKGETSETSARAEGTQNQAEGATMTEDSERVKNYRAHLNHCIELTKKAVDAFGEAQNYGTIEDEHIAELMDIGDAVSAGENESPEDEDSDDLGLQGLMSQDEEDEDCDELADAVEE